MKKAYRDGAKEQRDLLKKYLKGNKIAEDYLGAYETRYGGLLSWPHSYTPPTPTTLKYPNIPTIAGTLSYTQSLTPPNTGTCCAFTLTSDLLTIPYEVTFNWSIIGFSLNFAGIVLSTYAIGTIVGESFESYNGAQFPPRGFGTGTMVYENVAIAAGGFSKAYYVNSGASTHYGATGIPYNTRVGFRELNLGSVEINPGTGWQPMGMGSFALSSAPRALTCFFFPNNNTPGSMTINMVA
jgi:hypothetical protein